MRSALYVRMLPVLQLLSQSPFEQLAQYFYPVGQAFCFAGIKIYSSMLPTVLPLVLEFFYY